MGVRSKHIGGPYALSSGDQDVLQPPAGRTYVIRSVWLHNTSGAARTVTFHLNGNASTLRMWRYALQPGENVVLDHWWVMDNEDTLVVNSSGTGPIMTTFGAVLLGDPE